jgi:[ribosomal protein S5]-alanine N-acetyltransferase
VTSTERPSLTWPDVWPQEGPIRLRPYDENDLRLVAELAEDAYLPLIGTVPAQYSDDAGRAYLARQVDRLRDGVGFSFAVARRTDDLAVGGAGLWLDEHDRARASVGYAISPHHRRQGYATAALTALTRFAWTRPDLLELNLFVEPTNEASVSVAEASGFVRLALLPAHTEIGAERRDMWHYRSRRP